MLVLLAVPLVLLWVLHVVREGRGCPAAPVGAAR